MKWLINFVHAARNKKDVHFSDKQALIDEIYQAHADWSVAQQKLNWVTEKDQIDYAIYALEAAEKRYEMLLRRAKLLDWEDAQEACSIVFEQRATVK